MQVQLLAATALTTTIAFLVPGVAVAQTQYDWTGFYAGVGITGVRTSSDFTFTGITPSQTLSVPALGPGFTVQTGYNEQNGTFVFGMEVDGTLLNAPEHGSNSDFTTDSHLEELLTARLRLGVAADRMLFYATAGVGGGRATFVTDSGKGAPGIGSATGLVFGPVGGAGIEYAASDKISLKAEAKVYTLSTLSGSALFSFIPVSTDYTATYHPAGALITVGANVHF